jgi:hypothetical protein
MKPRFRVFKQPAIRGTLCLEAILRVITDGRPMQSQRSYKERLFAAADTAEKKAACATEPSVKDTLFALAALYRDMAKTLEELEHIRLSLRQHH